jgi:hypothetical protein
MNKIFAQTASHTLKEYIKPWQKLALTNFMHDITYGNGEITMLTCHAALVQYYQQQQIPMLCADKSGRTLAAGIYINKLLEQQSKDCNILMPLMVRIGEQFGQQYGHHSLHIVNRETDCQHLYSLFFDLSEFDLIHWVINNGHLLNDLIDQYNYFAKDLILEAKDLENHFTLPNYSEIEPKIGVNQPLKISLIHKHLNKPIFLSHHSKAVSYNY